MMWRCRASPIRYGIAVIAALLAVAPVQADQIVNGGFETGNFAGWTTIGTTSVVPGGNGPRSNFQALIQTNGSGVGTAALEAFFGLAPGSLAGLGNGNPTNGSGIQQTFNFTGNGTFSINFDANFMTDETAFDNDPNSFNDFSFVVINGTVFELFDTGDTPNFPGSFSYDSESGYFSFTLSGIPVGLTTIGFGVTNVTDSAFDSGLLIDNVLALPEPTSLALFGLAGLGAAVVAYRRKKAVPV